MATQIVFTKELSIQVEEDLGDVRRKLQTDAWPEFKASHGGGTVFVSSGRVAYVQEAASSQAQFA